VTVSGIADWAVAGANFNSQFVTMAGTDPTPPAITSVSPLNGAVGVSPNTSIVLTFSKPLNPATVNSSNFILSPSSGFSIVRSEDSMTVTLGSLGLQSNTKINVVVTHAVTDLSGNALATDFISSFTTGVTLSSQAQVTGMQPTPFSSSVSPDSTITLTFDRPVDPTTVANGVFVSQNGSLVSGALTLPTTSSVRFTPSGPFTPGATIRVFVTNSLLDANGVPVASYSANFTILNFPAWQPLSVVRTTAVRGLLAPDEVLDVEFNGPLDPATLDRRAGLFHRGVEIRGVLTLRDERTIRFVPAYAMTPDSEVPYELRLSGAIHAADGRPFRGQSFRFRVGGERSTTPSLASVKIEATEVRVEFTGEINPITANHRSIRLEDAAGSPVEFRIGFTPDDRSVVLYPLKGGAARVVLDGVEGRNGDRVITPAL
jgi:hypothetical protein